MSYEPTVWKNGDVITPEKLNKIEQGVAGGGGALIIEWDGESDLDVSYQDVLDAVNADKRVEMKSPIGSNGFAIYHLNIVSYGWDEAQRYEVCFSNGFAGDIGFYSTNPTDPLQPTGAK